MRILVCGGRDFQDREWLYGVLDEIQNDISVLIHGAAKGADLMAEDWAKSRQVNYCGIPAKWAVHGKAAGPIRNQYMLEHGKPHKVYAFPGGRGTEDMIRRATEAGVEVVRF